MIVAFALRQPVGAQETAFAEKGCPRPDSSPLLILGTYHMANPGLDAYNVEADDVLSPRRQAEIDELLERLARFAPTMIAIESKYGDEKWPERYQEYLAGEYELARSEIDQIALRLAKRLGHETVHPVDFPMWMNGWRNDEIDWDAVRARNEKRKEESESSEEESEMTEDQRRLLESSISDYLAWLNSDEQIDEGHAVYMEMLLPSEGIGIYSRADKVTNWYQRNIRIFTNLNRTTNHGHDRVLLLVGAGHLGILRAFAKDSPYFCLVDTEAYLMP